MEYTNKLLLCEGIFFWSYAHILVLAHISFSDLKILQLNKFAYLLSIYFNLSYIFIICLLLFLNSKLAGMEFHLHLSTSRTYFHLHLSRKTSLPLFWISDAVLMVVTVGEPLSWVMLIVFCHSMLPALYLVSGMKKQTPTMWSKFNTMFLPLWWWNF